MTTTPATLTVPVRTAPLVGVTESSTIPGPVPSLPLAIATHATWLCARQEQPGGAITGTFTKPPPAPTVNAVTPVAYVHAIPCTTWTLCPAMVRVPARDVPSAGPTSKTTRPFPLPLWPWTRLIQGTSAVADHVHWLLLVWTSMAR
ncbi:MAG TPA: hypothetical protein VJ813_03135 [Vicinamibacterales bacterium]|nr:hypothetical protein [Vicinamibacterales bacterium]